MKWWQWLIYGAPCVCQAIRALYPESRAVMDVLWFVSLALLMGQTGWFLTVRGRAPVSLRTWWRMKKLGYTWTFARHHWVTVDGYTEIWTLDAGKSWSWRRWREVGTNAWHIDSQHPVGDPVTAHVLAMMHKAEWGDQWPAS